MGGWAVTTSWESHPCISKLWWGKFAVPLQTTVVSVEPPLPAKGKEWCARKRAEKPSEHAGSGRVRAVWCTELSGRQCQPAEMAEQRRAEWSACQRQREHKEPTDGPTRPAASSREKESEREREAVVSANATWLRPELLVWKLATQDTWCRDQSRRFGA